MRIYVSIAESRIPLMTTKQIKNLEFFKLTHATNRTEFQDLIDGLSETMTPNLKVLIDLVSHCYQSLPVHAGSLPLHVLIEELGIFSFIVHYKYNYYG